MNKTNTIMMSQDDTSKGHILVVGHVTRDIFEDRQTAWWCYYSHPGGK